MRQYQSLFEEYGVVAVFSGHSEMFERSFVDKDNDGEGVYYYDVGVAGDGMRGERTDADGNLLNYNAFSQWTADQNEPELWQEVEGILQNVEGGKHYGHLEVNLENLGDEDGTRITFSPVYSIPILDANYDLVDTERRVYRDVIIIDLADVDSATESEDVQGTDKADTLEGTNANETITTLGGGDIAAGSLNDDIIDRGSGDDVLRGDVNSCSPQDGVGGNDIIFGGDGSDQVGGKAGNDVLVGDMSLTVEVVTCLSSVTVMAPITSLTLALAAISLVLLKASLSLLI